MGHARALLGLPDAAAQLQIGKEVVAKSLSVRETETLVKRTIDPPPAKPEVVKDVHTRAAEERLRFALGTRVRIVRKGKGGRVEIDFAMRTSCIAFTSSSRKRWKRNGSTQPHEEAHRLLSLRRLSEQALRR